MLKSAYDLKILIGWVLILLQVSSSCCNHVFRSIISVHTDDKLICGGVLIRPNFVLTSAYCLKRHNGASVLSVSGVGKRRTGFPTSIVKRIHLPAEFSLNNYQHMNIAGLELEEPLTGEYIKTLDGDCGNFNALNGDVVTYYIYDRSSRNLSTLELAVAQDYKYKHDVLYTTGPEGANATEYWGNPATIGGKLCAISISYPVCITCENQGIWDDMKDMFRSKMHEPNAPHRRYFTFLGNAKVKKFISDTLAKI